MDGSIEMIGVTKGAVGEMVALEVAPGALNIGQLGARPWAATRW
jgi:hypothetical protein